MKAEYGKQEERMCLIRRRDGDFYLLKENGSQGIMVLSEGEMANLIKCQRKIFTAKSQKWNRKN